MLSFEMGISIGAHEPWYARLVLMDALDRIHLELARIDGLINVFAGAQ